VHLLQMTRKEVKPPVEAASIHCIRRGHAPPNRLRCPDLRPGEHKRLDV
jgi:hypothetical protein